MRWCSALYELPFGRGKGWGSDVPRWADYVIGGWQLNGIYSLLGGTPFSITASGNPGSTRAHLIGNPSVNPGNITNYVDAAALQELRRDRTGQWTVPPPSV